MKHILELFDDPPMGRPHDQDSVFVRTARIKNEHMEMLQASMTDEQKQWLEAYFDADTKLECMMSFERFRYAFHLGAQLMAEMVEGKAELLG